MSVECPYCEFENDEPECCYEESELYTKECENCDKTFGVTVSISYDYSGHKMPCANGENHDWQPITGWPSESFKDKYRCSYCDEKKTIIKEEAVHE